MARFIAKTDNTFDRKPMVYCGDDTRGELDVTFERVSQTELDDLTEQGDYAVVKRVLKRVGDIPKEDSEEVMKGQEAIDYVLEDVNCVSACAADYMEAMKTKNFRKAGSGKRR